LGASRSKEPERFGHMITHVRDNGPTLTGRSEDQCSNYADRHGPGPVQ
jgi:hypothetical protein